MRPPALAEALVAAVAPTADYEMVAGDLNEEYLRIWSERDAKAADRWYWSQAVRSLPSLLSYSRSNGSALNCIRIALIALVVLVVMLACLTVVEMLLQKLFGRGIQEWIWQCAAYGDVITFGAILAWLVRADGLRVALFASVFLALCFVVPALAGHPGSQAPPSDWVLLGGSIPAMCIGAALYQSIKCRIDSSN